MQANSDCGRELPWPGPSWAPVAEMPRNSLSCDESDSSSPRSFGNFIMVDSLGASATVVVHATRNVSATKETGSTGAGLEVVAKLSMNATLARREGSLNSDTLHGTSHARPNGN